MTSGTDEERTGLLVVVKATQEDEQDTGHGNKECDESSKTHGCFSKGTRIFHVVR